MAIVKNTKVPDFIIGGAPRSGTTYLCNALQNHPDIFLAQPYIPEPKVFVGLEKPADHYFSEYRRYFGHAPEGKVLGEKSSGYLESDISCSMLKKYLPNVKLLFIMREPVARAYSNYWRTRENGLEELSFEEAVELEGQRPSPLPPEKFFAKPHDYMIRGHYDVFAERYIEAFGRNQIEFVLYEDTRRNPAALLERIQKFIGVNVLPFEKLNPGVINALKEKAPPMDVNTEKRLREKIAPSVRRFAKLTGLDVTPWGYDL